MASKRQSDSRGDSDPEDEVSSKVPRKTAQYVRCCCKLPKTRAGVQKLVEENSLKHGDIVNFSDHHGGYREEWSRIVKLVKEDEEFSDSELFREEEDLEKELEERYKDSKESDKESEEAKDEENETKEREGEGSESQEEDEAQAVKQESKKGPFYALVYHSGEDGYLGIPKDILADIDDGVTFYEDVNAEQTRLDLEISKRDKFVVNRLGQVPDDWEFCLLFNWGELDGFLVTAPGFQWDSFNPDTVTRKQVDEWYSSGRLAVIKVTFSAKENELPKYKLDPSSIPSSWVLESNTYGGSELGFHVSWNLSGPVSGVDEVKNAIANVLDGVQYNINENG